MVAGSLTADHQLGSQRLPLTALPGPRAVIYSPLSAVCGPWAAVVNGTVNTAVGSAG